MCSRDASFRNPHVSWGYKVRQWQIQISLSTAIFGQGIYAIRLNSQITDGLLTCQSGKFTDTCSLYPTNEVPDRFNLLWMPYYMSTQFSLYNFITIVIKSIPFRTRTETAMDKWDKQRDDTLIHEKLFFM